MKILIVSQLVFNEMNDRIHQWCVENIAQYNAVKWADELVHPIDGRIALIVDDRVINSLSLSEKANLIDLTEDWIKKESL